MANAVLLVVDVQRGLMEKGPWRRDELLEVIRRLETSFREKGREVVFVRHDDGPDSELAFGSSSWEVAEEIAPLPGEKIVDKRKNSAFLNTGLEAYLKEKGADTLVLTGMQTELCVDATCKSAFERGFRVIVPTDGCTTFDNSMLSAAALNRLFLYQIWKNRFAEILTPDEAERLVL